MNGQQEDIDMLVDTVRRFTQERIVPRLPAWEAAGEVIAVHLLRHEPFVVGGRPAFWRHFSASLRIFRRS